MQVLKAIQDALIPHVPVLVGAVVAALLGWIGHFKVTTQTAQNALAMAEHTVPQVPPGSPRLLASRNTQVRIVALENFNRMGSSALLTPRARERLIGRVADAAINERVTRG